MNINFWAVFAHFLVKIIEGKVFHIRSTRNFQLCSLPFGIGHDCLLQMQICW